MTVLSEPVSTLSTERQQANARSSRTRPAVTYGLVAAGIALVAVGALLPWLVVYNGLTAIPGYRLGGGPLAAVALAAAALVLVAVRMGGGRLLRPVAALGAAFVLAASLYLAHGVLGYVADPGPAGRLLMPAAGVGAYVMAAGALALLASALLGRSAPRPLSSTGWLQLGLAALTFGAGWVHLLLAPEHLEEHPLLGMGFIAAGAAQVVLAAVVLARPNLTLLPLLVVLDVAILAVYAYAVLVGLPFASGDGMEGMAGMDMHDDHGLVLGAGEAVDLMGGATFVMEVLGVGLVVVLIRRLARGMANRPA
ncbi:MAG: hypothetical protein ABIW80_10720 [Lapillicoccus sp.]